MGQNADVLKKARALIEQGWTQPMSMGFEENRHGRFKVILTARDPRVCEWTLCDAIGKAADWDIELRMEVEEFLRPFAPVPDVIDPPGIGYSLVVWADMPERTKAEVLALLSRGYARAAALESERVAS